MVRPPGTTYSAKGSWLLACFAATLLAEREKNFDNFLVPDLDIDATTSAEGNQTSIELMKDSRKKVDGSSTSDGPGIDVLADVDDGDNDRDGEEPQGGKQWMKPSTTLAKKISDKVTEDVNTQRQEHCPKYQGVTVQVVGPCTTAVQSGTTSTCVVSFTTAGAANPALHLVTMVEDATIGDYCYFGEHRDKDIELYCQKLMVSSYNETSLLQRSTNRSRKTKSFSLMTKVVLTDYGRTLGPFPTWFNQLQEHLMPFASKVEESPRGLPQDFSVLTGFTARWQSFRTSADCFPEAELRSRPGSGMVTNQGECGSCWAHAASSAVSDRMCLAGVPEMHGHGYYRTLSVQQVLSCHEEVRTSPCDGNRMDTYFLFAKKFGLALRLQSPYEMKCPRHVDDDPSRVVSPQDLGINCNDYGLEHKGAASLSNVPCVCVTETERPLEQPDCRSATKDVKKVFKLSDIRDLPWPGLTVNGKTFTIEDVVLLYQKELYANGPFIVRIEVFEGFNGHYKKQQQKVYIKDPEASARGGHAVVLTGWGVHMQLPYPWECAGSACDVEREVAYWEVRNSWGTKWADSGYFYVRRGTNEIEIESEGEVPVISRFVAGPYKFEYGKTIDKMTKIEYVEQ